MPGASFALEGILTLPVGRIILEKTGCYNNVELGECLMLRGKTWQVSMALFLVIAFFVGLIRPAQAAAEQVIFTGVDTVMIYNPKVDYSEKNSAYGTLSTGNMSGQIKVTAGNFDGVGSEVEDECSPEGAGIGLPGDPEGFVPPDFVSDGFQSAADRSFSQISEGEVKTFFYWPDYGGGYKKDQAEFTCLYAGERCLVWGYGFSDSAKARSFGEEFDSYIYANNTAYFGTGRFMEDGGKLNILVYDMNYSGIAGFFWSFELYTAKEQGSYAGGYNAGEPIIHLNSPVVTRSSERFNNATVAHEYQHLICASSTLLGKGYSRGVAMSDWLNESMSTQASDLSYPGVNEEKGRIRSYNRSVDVSSGQSLYNFATENDIGVYGQVFLFSEYIKYLNGGADVYKKLHDHWRSAAVDGLTDADAVYTALPQSVKDAVLAGVSYSDAVSASFGDEADEFLSKLALSFHIAAAVKESDGIYSLPLSCSSASPGLFTKTQCKIECGGRIFVKTADGNSYTVPSDASDHLIYVGFRNGEMVIPPTTASDYVASVSEIRGEVNDAELGSIQVGLTSIEAFPADGCGFSVPAYEILSGFARVEQIGNVFLLDSADGCTVRILFEKRAETVDVWDGSVADEIPCRDGIYVISTCSQLAKLAELVNMGNGFAGETVRLASHLDLNGLNWTPIGRSEGCSFQGTFDANGYAVFRLAVGSPQESYGDYAGLFGYVGGADALVRNLIMEETAVYGESCSGGLAGYCEGTVSDCMVSGSVSGTNDVGLLLGGSASRAVIRCAAQGKAAASGERVGGLIGSVCSPAEGETRITDCASRTEVSGDRIAGGLLGAGHDTLTVNNCYWAGTLSANEWQGGILGDPGGAVCSGCYHSSEGSKYGAAGGAYPGVTALYSYAMKSRNSYPDWDFDCVWKFFANYSSNGGLPALVWQRIRPEQASSDISFDKASLPEDPAIHFVGNGTRFLGVEHVGPVNAKGQIAEPYTMVFLSKEYLYTLPVGHYTMFALFSGGYRVPFGVQIKDSTGGIYSWKYRGASQSEDLTMVRFTVSSPEARDAMLVVAVYREGRMIDTAVVEAVLKHGTNDISLSMAGSIEEGCTYKAYLVAKDGFSCLTKEIEFK